MTLTKNQTTSLIVYILAIIVVNVVFIYLRYLLPDNKSIVTGMHVFFGSVQLMYTIPKILSIIKSNK